MENFQRTKELTKERILARRRERRNKLLWHVLICSSFVVIALSITVMILTAKANADYKVVIHSECDENAHFIISQSGEIIENLPLDEGVISISYQADGKLSKETYTALVKLTAQLINENHFEVSDVVRHYDTSKEMCPDYFLEYESAWEDFKIDVEEYVE